MAIITNIYHIHKFLGDCTALEYLYSVCNEAHKNRLRIFELPLKSCKKENINETFFVLEQNYITKPITQIQINCEMNRALRKLGTYNQKYIAVKNSNGFMKLFLSDIEYIETKDRNVLFHCTNGRKEIGHFKMQELEDKLNDYPFVRCHNGIIVNVDYIEAIHEFTVTLLSGEQIYTTKSRKKSLIQKVAERKGCI